MWEKVHLYNWNNNTKMIGINVETYFGATLEETYESTLFELKWALFIPYYRTIIGQTDNWSHGISWFFEPIKKKQGV